MDACSYRDNKIPLLGSWAWQIHSLSAAGPCTACLGVESFVLSSNRCTPFGCLSLSNTHCMGWSTSIYTQALTSMRLVRLYLLVFIPSLLFCFPHSSSFSFHA